MNYYALVINLWNPGHISGWITIIIVAILLGMIHGITPDEHTWPITFSYSIGSYSTRKGLKAGFIFSLAFTIQRAIASELAYLGLSRFFSMASVNNYIYIVVGLVMAVAGLFIFKRQTIFHFDLPFFKSHHEGENSTEQWLNDPRPWMPAVHGFVAGWGFGAFAIIVYTVLAPATHSAALAWVPGALFGIGTMIIQILAGALFGKLAARKGLDQSAIRRVALKTSGNTLTWGGLAFIVGGGFGIAFPKISSLTLITGIHVHNLDSIGLPFILVIFSVVIVGIGTLISETKLEIRNLKLAKPKLSVGKASGSTS